MEMNDLIIVIIPTLLVLGGVYFIVKTLVVKQHGDQSQLLKKQALETTLPLRIQAYERMALFLERISPNNLLLRMYDRAEFVGDFQQLLLKEVREEFYHNLAQQVYLSVPLWDEINKSMNDVMALINTSAADLKPDEPALHLSKKVFEKIINEDYNPTKTALTSLKTEVQSLF